MIHARQFAEQRLPGRIHVVCFIGLIHYLFQFSYGRFQNTPDFAAFPATPCGGFGQCVMTGFCRLDARVLIPYHFRQMVFNLKNFQELLRLRHYLYKDRRRYVEPFT
ncbi:MAG: hypothetical protein C4548_08745 [Desulfobacteraceae bacterium]|nr:MAG: hypothetical protein C4548_08745 [Desulfobacteraceae bacterium]